MKNLGESRGVNGPCTVQAQMERPIIFSGPMVRAVLEDRKSQTRRKNGLDTINQSPDDWIYDGVILATAVNQTRVGGHVFINKETGEERIIRCSYGVVGDRLWVRETWLMPANYRRIPKRRPENIVIGYKAEDIHGDTTAWRPSIHMPRWASRITLEITRVRVERLQDLNPDDAKAEGIDDGYLVRTKLPSDARCYAFRLLWDDLHGDGAWDENPWVWVVEFRRVPSVLKRTEEQLAPRDSSEGEKL